MLVRTIRFLGGSVLLLAASAISAGAQGPWNAANDFGATNPSGPWSYGASTTLGGTFHQSSVYTPNCDPAEVPNALNCWGDGRTDGSENQAIKNVTGSPVTWAGGGVTQPANELGLSVALDTAFTVLRFTAPNSGTFNLSGMFQNIFCCAPDNVYILMNSGAATPLFSGLVIQADSPHPGTTAPFSFSTFLNTGNTLDFIVEDQTSGCGPAGQQHCPGVVGIVADITLNQMSSTPEPSSMALLGTGLVGLVPIVRRRRNRR